jgi:hypothetical protein
MAGTKKAAKDLQPKTASIRGGVAGSLMGNDSLTLVRAAQSAKKDLPVGKDVKGGLGPTASLQSTTISLWSEPDQISRDLPATEQGRGTHWPD